MFASFLATAAVVAFIAANVRKYQGKKGGKITDAAPISRMYGYLSAFAAGVVTSNGLFHLLHGILGYGEFPAPFAKVLGRGLPSDIANIVWGLFNLAAAVVLAMRCRKSAPKWKLVPFYLVGVAAMGLLLRFVLLAGYFATHAF